MRKKYEDDTIDTSDILNLSPDKLKSDIERDVKQGKKEFFMSFIFLFLAIILFIVRQKMAWYGSITDICIFILLFRFLVLFFSNLGYIIFDKDLRSSEKYIHQELKQFSFPSIHTMKKRLMENNFTLKESGWFFKKTSGKSVSYFVKFCDSDNAEETINWQLKQIERYEVRKKSFCFILFLCMDTVTKETKDFIQYQSSHMIADTIIDPHIPIPLILIVLDRTSGKGWYIDVKNGHHLSTYAHGCRFLSKIFLSATMERDL